MNKQIGYITSAHLILFSIAAGYFFISKISSASNDQDQINLADHSTTVKETILSGKAIKGKTLFMSRCASCHGLYKRIEGPPLAHVLEKDPWTDKKQLYEWIRDPEGFMQKSAYARDLRKAYPRPMQAFPDIADEEIDLILTYIREGAEPTPVQ